MTLYKLQYTSISYTSLSELFEYFDENPEYDDLTEKNRMILKKLDLLWIEEPIFYKDFFTPLYLSTLVLDIEINPYREILS